MTKPSDFSPAEALEVKNSGETRRSFALRWALRAVGAGVLLFGWLAVSIHELGGAMFIVDTVVFVAMALYAFTAAAASRRDAVINERKLRLRLLVHNMELENMSMRDELTQLFNRRYLFERLQRELDTAKGFQRSLAFIAIEVRSLNHVNQTYGYAAGDQLLAAFGRLLMDCTRATDIPARMSGNQFGIILPDTSKRGVHTMLERLIESLAAMQFVEDSRLDAATFASFGVSGYPWSGDSVDAVVRQAEADMAALPGVAGAGPVSGGDQKPPDEIPAVFRVLDTKSDGS